MRTFRIADIDFQFSFNFDKYFKDNIEKYEVNQKFDIKHTIEVHIENEITLPNEYIENQVPFVIDNTSLRHIYYIRDRITRIYITHDHSYKNTHIYLNQSAIQDLEQVEYVFSGIMFLEIAMYNGYLPLHATAISMNDKAILFSANPGTGKSTIAKYWIELFNDAQIINDDKPLLSVLNNQVIVYGSPFSGEHKINANTSYPLHAIVFLEQGKENYIETLEQQKMIPELIKHTLKPKYDDMWDPILKRMDLITKEVPILKMKATHSKNAAQYAHDYLFKDVKQ